MKFKDNIINNFMIRKTKKQKTAFIQWVKEELKDSKYDINIEKGSFGARNIVIGDIKTAKVVFTAHYDTCAVMPVPNFITPTNFFIYLLYQIFLIVPMLLIAIGASLLFAFLFPSLAEFADLVYSFALLGILGLLLFGPPNKHTVNDNTSGVITILEMINKLPDKLKDKVAFVLFDLEEAGLFGSSGFSSKYKKEMKDKLLINFDCVSDGEKILFIFSKKAKDRCDLLKDVYVGNDKVESVMVLKGAFYPSDQANFPIGVGVCSVIKGKWFDYIDKIHTNKDIVFRKENVEYLVDKSIEFIDKI